MYKTITLILFVLCYSLLSAQTVSTENSGSFQDGLGIDSQGNIYCSDWSGNTVYKYDTNGNVTTFKNGFSNPNGIGVNSLDEIYICDHTANSISKYDTSGNLLNTYNTGLTTPAGIKNIPNTTDMLIVEYGTFSSSSKIKKLEADGTITTLFSGAPLNGPAGIAFINNVAYIGNYNDRKIHKYENGTLTFIAQLPNGAANSNVLGFLSAYGGQLIATQIGEHKIYSIDPTSSTVTLYAGSSLGNNDGDLSTATFNLPNGILGDDSNNRIYISDAGSKNLRIINNVSLSVEEFNNKVLDVKLFPNPASDSLNIKINKLNSKKVSISIINVLGKEVFKKDYNIKNLTLDTKINIENYATGTYTVRITSEKESISKQVIF